jgi:protein-S-isoprenylcysteine O-methyltransferase Ste14
LLVSLSLLLAPSASAFAVPKARSSASIRLASAVGDEDPSSKKFEMPNVDMDDMMSKLPDMNALTSLDLETIKDNLMDGSLGERGEAYAAAQFILLLCIVGGGIPLIGDPLMVLLGPVLMLAGAATFLLATKDLGSNLSPWAVPPKGAELVQDGIYSKLRHPQYAGILAALAGFSILTGSASRLLLTAALFYAFNLMADFEEEELLKEFPDYDFYQNKVTGKFFPDDIVKELPWMK